MSGRKGVVRIKEGLSYGNGFFPPWAPSSVRRVEKDLGLKNPFNITVIFILCFIEIKNS
jgi:hypothetical protein